MSPLWMPLYIADYRADTAHLGASEHGAYLLLIMHYWQTGGLPDDDRQLARIACMTPPEWKRARPVVSAFFADGWKHKRIDTELSHAENVIEKRRAAAHAKHSKSSASGDANAGAYACANAGAHDGDTRVPQPQSQSPRGSSSSSLRSDDAFIQGAPEREPELFAGQPAAPPASQAMRRNGFTPDSFKRWWAKYPHKVGKQDALKAFTVVAKSGRTTFEMLMEGLDRYQRTKPPDRPWCNPATWLRGGRWDDEPDHDTGSTGPHRPIRPQPRGGDAILAGMGNVAARMFGGRPRNADDPGVEEADGG